MSENKNEQPQAAQTEQELNELLQIRRDKLAKLQEAGKDPFAITTCPRDHYAQEIRDQFETLENQDVCIAGRVMSWRDMGKASFLDIHDKTGRMQVYVKIDEVGEETYKEMKACWDLGDIISVSGFVFKTRRGEISVHAKEIKLLSKSLLPLPEKFHGLKDTDLRYRQRYVDLIVNPEVKDTFVRRSQIVTEIRNFLNEKGFLEVETPVLHTIAGGASARPFITHHNTLDMDMYLRIALELYLKRLIVGGFDKVYELGRCFRNESTDASHENTFFQMEGIMIDKDISISNLIYFMKTMLSKVFKQDVQVRLRPGFFPFVEPGFELDISCHICGGKGCSTCHGSGWIELCPCGMIHPNVLRAGGIDPDEYTGFAFGLGLTRLAMMRYGIKDIRDLNSGNLKVLSQFNHE